MMHSTPTYEILVLDDDEEDAHLVERLLSRATAFRASVEWIDSYQAALARIRQKSFDVLILDYTLGGATGLDFAAEALRADPSTCAILLTGADDPAVDLEASRIGVSDFLLKGALTGPMLERAIRYVRARKDVDEQRASHAFLNATLDALFEQVAILDDAGQVIAVNRAWTEFAVEGKGPTRRRPAVGENYLAGDPVGPAASGGVMSLPYEAIRQMFTGARTDFATVYPTSGASPEKWLLMRAGRFDHGGHRRVVLTHEDITDRVEAETAVIESEARYRELMDTAQEGVWSMNPSGETTYVNSRMAELLGMPPSEVVGRHFRDFLPADKAEEVERAFSSTLRSGRAIFKADLRRADSHQVHAVFSVSARFDQAGEPAGLLAMVNDLTEYRMLEEQFYQAQKMEAVGLLAGGIAHDFNNLLTAILLNAHFVLGDPVLSVEAKQDVAEIQRAAERASRLTAQLLAFGRKQVLNPAVVDANTVVQEMVNMMQRVMGENIEQVVRLTNEPLWVNVDRGQLEQVLLNLLVNAKEAMSTGGIVSLITEAVEYGGPSGETEPMLSVAPGRYARIIVADTGVGMDTNTAERIFEPFFTTKDQGTGLGLSTVYGIVKQSGGDLCVESTPGLGARFIVSLPAVPAPAVAAPATGIAQQTPAGTILLVEDHDTRRTLARRVLQKMGYNVIEARDAAEAIEKWDTGQASPDLLISDMVMPAMSGPELAEALRTRKPGLKILFMSRYSEGESDSADIVSLGAYLQKPFTSEALANKVRDLLTA